MALVLVVFGPTNGYRRVKTLTDAFFQPSIMVSVPAGLEREKVKSREGSPIFFNGTTREFLTSTALVSCGMRYESVCLPVPSSEIKLLDAVDADGTSRTEHRPKEKGFCTREPSESVLNDLLLKIHKYFDRPGGSFPIFTISSHPALSTPTAVD